MSIVIATVCLVSCPTAGPSCCSVKDVTAGTCFLLCEDRAVPLSSPHTQSGGKIPMVPLPCVTHTWGMDGDPMPLHPHHGAEPGYKRMFLYSVPLENGL